MPRYPDADAAADPLAEGMLPPVIVLVETQLGENIGTTCRAMANFGLGELRLVAPRDGWPSDHARRAASRADHVLEAVRVFDTLEAAIGDCAVVLATTARPRDRSVPVLGPDQAAERTIEAGRMGLRTAILFGRERIGLLNDEVALAEAIVTLPVDPRFASLNIAQAVLVVAYEWRRLATRGALPFAARAEPPAPKEALIGLCEQLERALDATGYFRPPEKRPVMVRNLRTILQKGGFSEPEVRTLRGVVSALEDKPRRERRPRGPAVTPPKPRDGDPD